MVNKIMGSLRVVILLPQGSEIEYYSGISKVS